MAKIKGQLTVDVELTFGELELIRRALELVDRYGEMDDEQPARELLVDLAEVR